MGNIGDIFNDTVPPVGSTGPAFANTINNILTECINRLSTKVPFGSIVFNSNLDLQGQALLNTGYLTFSPAAVTPSGSPFARLSVFSNDLYFVNPAGAVQITTGNLLNAASVGGITGDYGGVNPAQFRYTAATTRYDSYANFSTGTWAYARALGLDIAAGATSGVFARLAYAGSVNRTFTFPNAPATSGQRPLFIDNSGQLVVGHGSKVFSFSSAGATIGALSSGTFGDVLYNSPSSGWSATSTGFISPLYKPIDGLVEGFQITAFTVNIFNKVTATACTFDLQVNGSSVGSGSNTTINPAKQNTTVVLGTPVTIAANDVVYLVFHNSNVNQGEFWQGVQITGNLPT